MLQIADVSPEKPRTHWSATRKPRRDPASAAPPPRGARIAAERHAAAIRVQRIQRGRIARRDVAAMKRARAEETRERSERDGEEARTRAERGATEARARVKSARAEERRARAAARESAPERVKEQREAFAAIASKRHATHERKLLKAEMAAEAERDAIRAVAAADRARAPSSASKGGQPNRPRTAGATPPSATHAHARLDAREAVKLAARRLAAKLDAEESERAERTAAREAALRAGWSAKFPGEASHVVRLERERELRARQSGEYGGGGGGGAGRGSIGRADDALRASAELFRGFEDERRASWREESDAIRRSFEPTREDALTPAEREIREAMKIANEADSALAKAEARYARAKARANDAKVSVVRLKNAAPTPGGRSRGAVDRSSARSSARSSRASKAASLRSSRGDGSAAGDVSIVNPRASRVGAARSSVDGEYVPSRARSPARSSVEVGVPSRASSIAKSPPARSTTPAEDKRAARKQRRLEQFFQEEIRKSTASLRASASKSKDSDSDDEEIDPRVLAAKRARDAARTRAAWVRAEVQANLEDDEHKTRALLAFFNARAEGKTLIDPSYERAACEAAIGMPALEGCAAHLPAVFAGCSAEMHPAGAVIAREGERGEEMCVVVGGEVGLFQLRDNPKGAAGLETSDLLWDPIVLSRRPKTAFATEKASSSGYGRGAVRARARPATASAGAGEDAKPRRRSMREKEVDAVATKAGDEEECVRLGAPRRAGRLARRVKFGECFGEGAVTRPKGEEARGATAVALADVVLLTLRKWKYDAILGVVEASAAQKTREFLRTTDLFPRDRVSDADLLALAEKLTATRVAPGDVVVKSGDAPKGVFFIVSGTARVYARSAKYVDGVYLDGRGSARSSSSAPWAGIDREPLALRKNTGRGGGAIRDGDPRLGKVTEIALGVLSTPALFGEECLAPRAKDEGSEGVGTHLFTVKAGGGGEEETKSERLLHALRLDPEDARWLPPSVSRRLRSLAKSTAAAAREAHDALKATPPEAMVDGGNDENAPAPARAARRASGGGGGGSKSAPTTPALRPSGSGSGTRRSPRDFRRSSGDRIPIGVGLGGGGGRLREVGRRAEERIERRRGGTTTPTTTPTRSEPGRRRDRDGDRRAESASPARAWDHYASIDADEDDAEDDDAVDDIVAAPSARRASSRPRTTASEKLAKFLSRKTRNRETPAPAAPAPARSSPARYGAPAPVVRMTKKAAAMAARNRPTERWASEPPFDGGEGLAASAPARAPRSRVVGDAGRVGSVRPLTALAAYARETNEDGDDVLGVGDSVDANVGFTFERSSAGDEAFQDASA